MMMSKQFSLSSLKTTKVPWYVDVKKFIFTEFISFFLFFLSLQLNVMRPCRHSWQVNTLFVRFYSIVCGSY